MNETQWEYQTTMLNVNIGTDKRRGKQVNKPIVSEHMIQTETSKADVISCLQIKIRTLEYLVKCLPINFKIAAQEGNIV